MRCQCFIGEKEYKLENLQLQGLQELESIKPYCHYIDIQKLILEIYDLHNDFSSSWTNRKAVGGFQLLNLKNKQVRHVSNVVEGKGMFVIDNAFYQLIKDYMSALNSFTGESDLEFDYINLDLRTRIKQNESVVNKLKYYRIGKVGQGAFNLNKCLNDLFGLRIIIDDFDHNCEYFDDLCGTLKSEYRIKAIDASKHDYKATHIYFYGDSNRYFPWELQIWSTADVVSNDESHFIHKQEYKSWANIYKNSEEIQGGV